MTARIAHAPAFARPQSSSDMHEKRHLHAGKRILALALSLAVCAQGGLPSFAGDREPAARPITRASASKAFSARLSGPAVEAVRLALKGRYDQARAVALRSRDAVAVKLVEWLYLLGNPKDAPASRLLAFVDANPRWPLARTFRVRAERRLMLARDIAASRAYFARHKPISAYGHLAFAWLNEKEGKPVPAARHVRLAWLDPGLSVEAERFALQNLRRHISRDLDARRMDRLIVAQRTIAAMRAGRRVSSSHYRAAEAARALIRFRRNGPVLYRRLPASMRNRASLRYALARYYRKRGPVTTALSMLERAPARAAQLDPVQWWVEKRLVARYMMGPKHRRHWRRIYRLMATHGFSRPGKPAYRGEFLAGFMALEKLHDAKTALKHFTRLPKLAKSRTWKSKGWYWVGRAREALGDIEGARRAYRESAKTPTVYYGLLSREKIGLGRRPIPLKEGHATAEAKARINRHELVRAVRLLASAGGRGRDLSGYFVWPLAYAFNRRDELAAVASLLWDAGGPSLAVRLAKAAGRRGIDLDNYGYPVRALPRFRHLGPPLEEAALLGLIRQESEFNARAGSHAGAKGFMQLMPGTARREARILRVPYRTSWLTARPSYNLMLGRHHLARLIEKFGGSYVLGFAAYNAGGGNVRKWLQAYGDFRSGRPDPVEWVEMIPITETRLYVQKVLQGTHVYRTRLKRRMLPMTYDLWRGVPGWHEHVLPPAVAKPRKAGTRAKRKEAEQGDRASAVRPQPTSGGPVSLTEGKGKGRCGGANASIADLVRNC